MPKQCCILHVYICKPHNTKQIHRWTLSFQVRTVLFTSDFGSPTRGERQFLKVFRIIQCWQHPNARHISWSNLNFSKPWSEPQLLNILVGPQLLNTMVWPPTSQHPCRTTTSLHQGQNSTSLHHGCNSTKPFSKSSKFSAFLFGAWRHPHSSPFPVWHLLWQLWLSYPSCTRVKLYPMSVHLN